MKNKLVKRFAAVTMVATVVMGMSVSAFAADGGVYAKFCKDGTTTVSMTQMAVDGTVTVEENGDGTINITIPLDGFKYKKMGITAIGTMKSLTIDGNKYEAVSLGDTDGDGYDNGTITLTNIDEDKYDVDGSSFFDAEVKADLKIFSGAFTKDMTSDVDLYFTTTQPVYSE